MTVLCVNSGIVYADITAADAAEAGIDYGVATRFEQTGVSSGAVVFSGSAYASSIIYIATTGEETDGTTSLGAQCTGLITTSVDNATIKNLRTGRLTFTGLNHKNENLVSDGGGGDVYLFNQTLSQSSINCIRYNCSEGCRANSTNDNYIELNCTVVDATGFGVLRPRAVDSVSLNTNSSAYLQIGASSSNYWADDGTGSNAITETVKTDIFEDYAGGDYRIKAASSVGIAGAGAFINSGGGGVTVTGTTPTFNYSSVAASIDLTGSIDVTGQTANYTYSVVSGAVDLTGDISITGATASYNYQSINGLVDLTGEITVLGVTPNQSYSSVSGIIELGAVISVVGLTPNYNYQGAAGEVSLNGEILVSGETPSYSYSAIKGFVTTGKAQVIGTVTSSFASDVYSSGFKPSTITVNFKS